MTLSIALALSVALAEAPARPAEPQQKAPAHPAQTAPPADKTTAGTTAAKDKMAEALRIQVMLDRAGFSPGVIDGRVGPSTRKALAAYQKQAGETPQAPFE